MPILLETMQFMRTAIIGTRRAKYYVFAFFRSHQGNPGYRPGQLILYGNVLLGFKNGEKRFF
jgi:hypothetical protein